MALTATWWLGQQHATVKGTHKPGTPQKWTITVVGEGNNGVRERWTLRPAQKCTLHDLHDYIMDSLAQFEKENLGFSNLTWTAISR